MEIIHKTGLKPARVAVFPGAWNPPTIAHLAMARAALAHVDEVVWVLPRAFPHKGFEGASFEDRRRMLELLASAEPGFAAAVAEGGLYAEIADEAAEYYGPQTSISMVCGRDAADRIANWDYGQAGFFENMIRRYRLLVAAREGDYVPAPEHTDYIASLFISDTADGVSSSEVRRRIACSEPWEDLVPGPIVDSVRSIYEID